MHGIPNYLPLNMLFKAPNLPEVSVNSAVYVNAENKKWRATSVSSEMKASFFCEKIMTDETLP